VIVAGAVAPGARAGSGPTESAGAGASTALPGGELAGESWDVVARLDSGDLVLAQAIVTNLGLGDGNANVVGYWIAPDGTERRFKRSEPGGRWLSTGGDLDLHSIALDPAGPQRRLEVRKSEVGIDVVADARRPLPQPPPLGAGCRFDLLDVAAPGQATLRPGPGAPRVSHHAWVAWTHRTSPSFDSECVLRRVEVFFLEQDLGGYFTEVTTPRGETHRWLLATRGGRVVFAGVPDEVALDWERAQDGYPEPRSLRLRAGDLEARVRFGSPLVSVDPLERLAAPIHWLVSTRVRPRLEIARAPFEVELGGADGGARASWHGEAVAKITYTNPLPRNSAPEPEVAHSEESR
jgi:hypothetical protein